MRKVFSLVLMSSLLLPASVNAALSWFSRANCTIVLPSPHPIIPPPILTFNESISWDFIITSRRYLATFSHHNLGAYANQSGTNHHPLFHTKSTGYQYTWRSYAGDISDSATLDWWVHGNHWLKDQRTGMQTYLGWTYARNCNLGEW